VVYMNAVGEQRVRTMRMNNQGVRKAVYVKF
jgi:hypothetical protein